MAESNHEMILEAAVRITVAWLGSAQGLVNQDSAVSGFEAIYDAVAKRAKTRGTPGG